MAWKSWGASPWSTRELALFQVSVMVRGPSQAAKSRTLMAGGVPSGLAGLAVVAGVLRGEETVEGGGDRCELSVNDDETSVEPSCHNGCRSAAPGRVQGDVPYLADFAQAQASRDRETAVAVPDAT